MKAYRFFSRASDGALVVATKHPPNCLTWHWSVSIYRRCPGEGTGFAALRTGQWSDTYWLPFGYALRIGRQDWHVRTGAA